MAKKKQQVNQQQKQKNNEKTEPAKKKYSLIKDERIKFILGLAFLSFAIFFLLAFVSYLFTWRVDQSKLDVNFSTLISDADISVENWAGKTGAFLAHLFIHKWFGIASFSLIIILIVLAFKLVSIRLLSLQKTVKNSILISIWMSITLGYLFGDTYFFLGGAHGYFISKWLNALVGKAGTAFVTLIALFAFLILTFDRFFIRLKNIVNVNKSCLKQKLVEKTTEKNKAQEEEKQEINEAPINLDDLSFEVTQPQEETNKNEDSKESFDDNIQTLEVKESVSNVSGSTDEESVDENEGGLDLTIVNKATEEDNDADKIHSKALGDYDPTLDLSSYRLPTVDLLDIHEKDSNAVTNEELVSNKNKIVETLANYKIKIDKIRATIGPTITLYEIIPAPGVRISKIKNLEDDIALSLAALGIRIIAPMPGKGTIGIEVPNIHPEIVSMRSVISSKKFQESQYELPIVLGKTISNETYVVDLVKMPHLLVAGATGQGKSVGLNAILTSLLYKKHPSQLKFVLIDPKKVELTLYSLIEKHFLAKMPDTEEAIITDTQKVVNTLNSLCVEMDQRYDLLKLAHTRNIKEYNAKFIKRKLNPEKGHRFLPYIVVVIDEYADLIMTAGKEIEMPIARLAQLARAIGIHLIIATQRPTTNIITGLIKANFPTRIAFRVTSSMDSRTILDQTGANQLIGRGDMLISNASDLTRVQCAFVDTPEIERVIEYIEKQQAYPSAFLLPEYVDDASKGLNEVDLKKRDGLFDDAARLIVNHQQGSTSLIQRKFSIGYNRAGRIIDQLEAAGVVGPNEGSKARQVLIPDEYSLEQLLNRVNNQ
ncbi:MAG: DNA translocase FtsK 4TM domain-containing protein [Bacteroidetes bacterium]|nr:DNA translocase FtsK 4TM domain-containing protein [Bacteroidota bacterium]